ncbi:MAG: hypothetical protein II088_00915, partial [Bacteroidales bacterium]|nr:hypothetical protein [Bacteroidales bacterium]
VSMPAAFSADAVSMATPFLCLRRLMLTLFRCCVVACRDITILNVRGVFVQKIVNRKSKI